MRQKYKELGTLFIEDVKNFLLVILTDYRWILELLGATLLIYVFYHLGRLSKRDPMKQKIDKLNSVEQNKEKLTASENASLNRIRKIKYLIVFFSLVILAINVMFYVSPDEINTFLIKKRITPLRNMPQKIVLSVISLVIVFVFWKLVRTYERYVHKSTQQRIKNLEIESVSDFNELFQILGQQTTMKIKNKICKDLIVRLNKEAGLTGSCNKQKCKDQRRLLQQSYDIHNNLIKSINGFPWCETCLTKKKLQKIELMSAEPVKVYNSEEQQVKDKTKMIYDETAKISAFLDQLCQNFCSFRFKKMSQAEGAKYKFSKQSNKKRQQTSEGSVKV